MCDFAPGDLVVCVDDALRPCSPADGFGSLKRGRAYRVERLQTMPSGKLNAVMLGYNVDGIGWRADRFRKLNDTADDAELIERIKRCKPVREREPA